MTQEVLKHMYQLLLTEPHAPTVCAQLERIAREALADYSLYETQRLGQEIEQEPVAWIHNFIEGGISIGKRPADLNRHPDRWTALYKDPKPCPTCEALARTVMLDQTSHDTTPPQRTWVELTDEQIEDCYKQGGIGRAIQLFKEKNT